MWLVVCSLSPSLLGRPRLVLEPWSGGLDSRLEPGGKPAQSEGVAWPTFSGPGTGQDLRQKPVPSGTELLVPGNTPFSSSGTLSFGGIPVVFFLITVCSEFCY